MITWLRDTLPAVVDALARGFCGRPVRFAIGHLRLGGVLEALVLEPRPGRYGARLRLSDVECDGLCFETLSVVVDAVVLTPPPQVGLNLFGVELEGRASLISFVSWLNPRVPAWRLGVTEGGLIEAAPLRGARRLVLVPVIADGRLTLELWGIRWGRVDLRLPSRLRRVRALPMPALPAGMLVSEARLDQAGVNLRASIPAATRVALGVAG